ncbi:MAG: hypothetical protein RIR51_52 [Bacteroidota bacterium]|jgi:para-nitrobenzyl esterase
MKKIIILLLSMSFMGYGQVSDYNLPVQKNIEHGIIEGNFDTKSNVSKFFGIPFAKAPVGELRWKAPQDLEAWKGIKETKSFGPRPVQGIVFGDMHSRSAGLSEDCLYLNVWTPAKESQKNLPVLVYFYGGGNVAGDGSEPRYDGEHMAQQGIVVVTCNYRLNIFGNFAHPELSAETSYKGSGNYGYMDQLAALKWVKKNIAQFGGNPNHVTIAGESAGSISVSYQMASPLAKGLVHAAIGESGAGIFPTMPPVSLIEAEKQGKEFTDKAGVTSIAALRKMSTKEIFELYSESKRFGFPVVVDNYFLPKTLVEIFEEKEHSDIPLLAGWNSAEIPGMAFMQGKTYTPENYLNRVKAAYPNDWEEIIKLYPGNTEKEVEYSATALASDSFISYATWKWTDLAAKKGTKPVYRYLYSKLRPPLVNTNLSSGFAGGTVESDSPAPQPKLIGAPHACEIEYCMGNLHLVKEYAWTKDDYKTSETMFNYFANFIKTYNPNGEKLPNWGQVNAKDIKPSVMIIDTESSEILSEIENRYHLMEKLYSK